jgi:PilZ domain
MGWTARPNIPLNRQTGLYSVANPSTRHRAEERVPHRMFVRLYAPNSEDFEMAQTIDVSRHGARVSTKKAWAPNEHLVVRSLRGNLTSYARVAHCQPAADNSYYLGLELYSPVGAWK